MTVPTEQHRPWLSKTPVGRADNARTYQWQAKCACGMRGDVHDFRDDAGEQAQQHVDGAA